jgi:S-DNA-T family DNA segregation ATPase FtsK/SpoIIIE
MARIGARNIAGYNQKLRSYDGRLPEDLPDLEHLPYLVIVIDELADLMLTAPREVEQDIMRLAQLARAAGIHMILATQRPSVDIVTGLIKVNLPCRISFQMASKHDSRTILDTVGAEHLLGKGDMLFKRSSGKLLRLQGPFVGDEEVEAVVNHWKRALPPSYSVNFSEWNGDGEEHPAGDHGGDVLGDPLYPEVARFAQEQDERRVSIGLLQRRFRLGFNRAARMKEQLERDGIVDTFKKDSKR